MHIEEIFSKFDFLASTFYEKSRMARETAQKARKRGDMRKSDKFHAIARVYEMALGEIDPLACELLQHTSKEFQDNRPVPF